ncbi:MAG: hypothetical protein PHF58_10580 [Methylotenera sp.]|nr:hypothetical protein [Methylotenera sp.]
MITQEEAEALAKKHLQDYVNACGCNTTEDAANALMKMASLCGVFMCAMVGQAEAVARLEGTAAFIAKPEIGANWKYEVVQ